MSKNQSSKVEQEPVAWRKMCDDGFYHLFHQNVGWKDSSGFEPLYDKPFNADELQKENKELKIMYGDTIGQISLLDAKCDVLQTKLDLSRRKLTELSKDEALENLYQLAMGQEREIVKLEKERDALMAAAKLGLHELEWWLENSACKATQKAIEALKKAGVTP